MERENPDTQDLIIRMKEKLCLKSLDQSVRLVAVIFADRVPHKPTTIDMLKKAWASFGEIGITARDDRDPNDRVFAVTVRNDGVAKDIMENSPWSVKGFSVHVQPWPDHLAIEELPINNIAFWIQMRGVPPYMYTMPNVEDMVEHFGEFIKMDDPLESGDGTYSFLRVRVLLDGRGPLPPGFTLPRDEGEPSWVEFKYEKLSRFCFCCGRLGHIETTQNPCPNSEEERPADVAYGEWMITGAFRRPGQLAQLQVIRPERKRRIAGQRLAPASVQEIGQSSDSNTEQRQNGPSQNRHIEVTTLNHPDQYQLSHELSLGLHNGQEPYVSSQNQQVRSSYHSPSFQNLFHHNPLPQIPSTHQSPQLYSHIQTNVTSPQTTLLPMPSGQINFPYGSSLGPTQPNSNPTSLLSKRPVPRETTESIVPKKFKRTSKTNSPNKPVSNTSRTLDAGTEYSTGDDSIGGIFLQGGGGWPTATRPQ